MMARGFDMSGESCVRQSGLRWLGVVMLALVLLGPWPGTVTLAVGAL